MARNQLLRMTILLSLIINCLLVTGCASAKKMQTIMASETPISSDRKFKSGPQACSILHSFVKKPSDNEFSDEINFDWQDPSFVFHGDDASLNTNCTFEDGSIMNWQDIRERKVSRVCFLPDYSRAKLIVTPNFISFNEYHFQHVQDAWVPIGKTSYDHVLVDGGYSDAKTRHKTNSYYRCEY